MAKVYSYEAEINGVTKCKMSIFDDGHWEFDFWPDNADKDEISSYMESFANASNRMLKHGLTKIIVKKL